MRRRMEPTPEFLALLREIRDDPRALDPGDGVVADPRPLHHLLAGEALALALGPQGGHDGEEVLVELPVADFPADPLPGLPDPVGPPGEAGGRSVGLRHGSRP